MRSAIVPAQITTVEDKVAGNLSLSQLLLLSAPIFAGSVIFAVLPPLMGGALYKTALVVVATTLLWLLAIRVKGRILLLWAITIGRYNLRSRFFVFDKNDTYLRPTDSRPEPEELRDADIEEAQPRVMMPALSTPETVMLEAVAANPEAKLHFKIDRKGGLSVRIHEVR